MALQDVVIAQGRLAGQSASNGTVTAFRGIPYAAPPIGNLRWSAPQPPAKWAGTYNARNCGPRSIQPERPTTAIGYFGPERESEDCLYLNVWTAAQSRDEARPVMVWFHGGANVVGSGSLPIFDGERLARRGVIIVTVNYRLGRLGFLAHPDLAREADYRTSGNYGWLDQIAALEWVQQNISAFGGDPHRVTIFGQSAGGGSVNGLIASPIARGLFHRAIGQSGGSIGERSMLLRDEAERAGIAFANGLGAGSLEELRALPARQIQLIRLDQNKELQQFYDSNDPKALTREIAWPIVDGYVLTDRVRNIFEQGAHNDVPLITGSTRDEGTNLPCALGIRELEAWADNRFGSMAETFLDVYSLCGDADAEWVSRAIIGSRVNWENWMWGVLHAANSHQPVFSYVFDRVPPRPIQGASGDLGRDLGAFHTAEIPYIFDHLHVRDWPWEQRDHILSDAMASYWVNFAQSGNPNGAGRVEWPQFDLASQFVMRLGDSIGPMPMPYPERLEPWTKFEDSLRQNRIT